MYIDCAGDKTSHQFLLLCSYPKVPEAESRIYLNSVQPDMSGVLVAGTLYSHVVVMVCMCRPMKPKVFAGPFKSLLC